MTSERLTDDLLLAYIKLFETRSNENALPSPPLGSFLRDQYLAAMELRERRAQDLTSFEQTVLSSLRGRIADDDLGDREYVRILDKILARSVEVP